VSKRYGKSLIAVAAASVAAAVSVAGPAGANYVATSTDPAGDAGDPNPARDLTAVGLSYDRRTGELLGAVRLRGEPAEESRAFLTLVAGPRTPTGCNGYPASGFGSYSDEFGASWLRLDSAAGDGPRGEADKHGYLSEIQQFEVTDRRLAGQKLDCVIATLTEPNNPAHVYDSVGPLTLRGQPALSMRVAGARRTFLPGRSRRVTVTLRNTGDARTRPVRVRFNRARGLTVKAKSTRVKGIAPGGRRRVALTVRLSSRARTATPLKLKASAGELVVRQETTLYVRKPSKPGGGGGGGGDGTQSCVRYQADLSGETGGSLILVPC
jgi:hypothetical protein